MLDGWKQIAVFLSRFAGYAVSIRQVRHWAENALPPLPVERMAGLVRPRIRAKEDEVRAWWEKETNSLH